jgi:hypothetical protein
VRCRKVFVGEAHARNGGCNLVNILKDVKPRAWWGYAAAGMFRPVLHFGRYTDMKLALTTAAVVAAVNVFSLHSHFSCHHLGHAKL